MKKKDQVLLEKAYQQILIDENYAWQNMDRPRNMLKTGPGSINQSIHSDSNRHAFYIDMYGTGLLGPSRLDGTPEEVIQKYSDRLPEEVKGKDRVSVLSKQGEDWIIVLAPVPPRHEKLFVKIQLPSFQGSVIQDPYQGLAEIRGLKAEKTDKGSLYHYAAYRAKDSIILVLNTSGQPYDKNKSS
jgi:hypothetical protein